MIGLFKMRILITSLLLIFSTLLIYDIEVRLELSTVQSECERFAKDVCAPCQEILDGKKNSK